jgi:hypothetical protein
MKLTTYVTAFAAAVAIFGIGGCSAGTPSVVGHWKIDPKSVKSPTGDPKNPGNALAAGLEQGIMNMFSLDFRADKTFSMTMLFPLEGTYTQTGHKLTLHITKAMGMDIDALNKQNGQGGNTNKDGTATISDDGSKITLDELPGDTSKNNSGPKIFVRG